jgi:hypothetical protein
VRCFLWEEPADSEVAGTLRQMLEGATMAGEGEMQAVFAEKAEAHRKAAG